MASVGNRNGKGHPAFLARTHTFEGLKTRMGNIHRGKSRDAEPPAVQNSTPAEPGCVTVGVHVLATGVEPRVATRFKTRVRASPTPCFSSRLVVSQRTTTAASQWYHSSITVASQWCSSGAVLSVPRCLKVGTHLIQFGSLFMYYLLEQLGPVRLEACEHRMVRCQQPRDVEPLDKTLG